MEGLSSDNCTEGKSQHFGELNGYITYDSRFCVYKCPDGLGPTTDNRMCLCPLVQIDGTTCTDKCTDNQDLTTSNLRCKCKTNYIRWDDKLDCVK